MIAIKSIFTLEYKLMVKLFSDIFWNEETKKWANLPGKNKEKDP